MATPGHPNGHDVLIGTSHPDRIFGRGGEDMLFGGGGNDKLYGGLGRDMLNGGAGNDVLRGDAAGKLASADIFAFGKHSGKDTITDFDIGKDVIVILDGINGIKQPADVLDHARQVGKDVVINLGGGNKITLKKVDIDDLKKNPGDHFEVTKMLPSAF